MLIRAYRWLRHAEHVLQLEGGLQTQTIPSEPNARALFARRLGYVDGAALDRVLIAHTSAVAWLFGTLGDGQETERPDVDAILGGELPEEAELEALARLGFQTSRRRVQSWRVHVVGPGRRCRPRRVSGSVARCSLKLRARPIPIKRCVRSATSSRDVARRGRSGVCSTSNPRSCAYSRRFSVRARISRASSSTRRS